MQQKQSPSSIPSQPQKIAQNQIQKQPVMEKKPRIMSQMQKVNELILHKGFAKVKVFSHFTLPTHKKQSKNQKPRMLLIPSTYTLYKLKQQIKRAFNINQKQAIFLFVKNQKIVQSTMTIKQMYDRFVGPNSLVVGCLQLSAYNSEFSG